MLNPTRFLTRGDAQLAEGDSRLVIRDMFGKIEITELKHEEPWICIQDKFIVGSKDDKNYILPVRVLPGRMIAAAMADGNVMLIEVENRRTARINQGEACTVYSLRPINTERRLILQERLRSSMH